MTQVTTEFLEFYRHIAAEVEAVEGFLGPKEIRFLSLLGAYPTAIGETLEIGSFKGKSTVVLAKAAALTNSGVVHAVDPMINSSVTDPDLGEGESSLDDFRRNVERYGVASRIQFHRMRSEELAETWNKPLRLLWIDGDHTYKGAKLDFDGFYSHLADGAIIALDDVLHEFEGCIRVFMEDVLLSPNFGACGLVGSIGWAQFHKDAERSKPFRREKLSLYKRMSRLLPFVAFGNSPKGMEKKKFKLFRSRIPRSEIPPEKWVKMVNALRS